MIKFSSRDICAIIKACGETGVQRLSMGELDIIFAKEEAGQPTPEQIPTGPWGNPSVHNADLHPAEMGSQEEQQAFVTQHSELVDHLHHANLLLDDPSAFEQECIDEALERENLL